MDYNSLYLSIYRLIESNKPAFSVLEDITSILNEFFRKASWNIGVIRESTGELNFLNHNSEWKNLNNKAYEIFGSDDFCLKKQKLPGLFKKAYFFPIKYNKNILGVLICKGKIRVKRKGPIKRLGKEIGFVYQQYSLKSKLVKETMLMNTVMLASQSTASSKELDSLIGILLPRLKDFLDADYIRLYIFEENDAYYNEKGEKIEFKFSPEKSIIKYVRDKNRPLMLREAYTHPSFNPEIDSLGEEKRPMNLIASPVKVKDGVKGVLLVINNDENRFFVGSELVWVKGVCGEIGASTERIKLYKDMKELFLSSIEALSAAIDGKDPYTHGHSRRVTMYSMVIGKKLGLDKEELERVRLSSLLHDIGKIAVSESILLKKGKLTEEEWAKLKEHPVRGVKMLEAVKEFASLFPGIKHHHERWDGMGYPDGLKGEEIPLIARIISVADAFDAMTSKRSYRNALSEKEALEELERCKGTQFDNDIAEIFIKLYREKFYTAEG
ncbi:MAG: GAF and HD-GYP domain-containing protein [Elusimicrobiota bacterium]